VSTEQSFHLHFHGVSYNRGAAVAEGLPEEASGIATVRLHSWQLVLSALTVNRFMCVFSESEVVG